MAGGFPGSGNFSVRAVIQSGRRRVARRPRSTRPAVTRLEAIIRADPDLMDLLRLLRDAGLPQWRLVSGCLYQTVWNALTSRPRGTGIQDFDVIYFDAADLSWEAEDAVIKRVTAAAPLQI